MHKITGNTLLKRVKRTILNWNTSNKRVIKLHRDDLFSQPGSEKNNFDAPKGNKVAFVSLQRALLIFCISLIFEATASYSSSRRRVRFVDSWGRLESQWVSNKFVGPGLCYCLVTRIGPLHQVLRNLKNADFFRFFFFHPHMFFSRRKHYVPRAD